MKLYLPATAATSTLPSRWTASGYPISSVDPVTVHLDAISDNRPMPFFPLSNYPDQGGPNTQADPPEGPWRRSLTFGMGGTQLQAPNLGKLDYYFFQMFTCGFPLAIPSGTTTIPVEWVCPKSMWATCYFSSIPGTPATLARIFLGVPFVYIYRPSTGAVVGTLARPTTSIQTVITSAPYYGGPNNTGTIDPTCAVTWLDNQIIGPTGSGYTRADVAGVQTGDYIVYEVWGMASGQRVFTGSWGCSLQFFIGNGKVLELEPQEDGKYRQSGVLVATDQYFHSNADDRSFSTISPPPYTNFFYLDDLAITTPGVGLGFPNVGAPCPPTEVIAGGAQACNAFTAPTGGTATDI